MVANRRADTKPELALRSALHRRGRRYRKDFKIRAGDVTVRPDIVFTKFKLAVFVDGCFWHSCPQHLALPKTNTDYWIPKLKNNVDRDRRQDRELTAAGWAVLRLWEHEPLPSAVEAVETALRDASGE